MIYTPYQTLPCDKVKGSCIRSSGEDLKITLYRVAELSQWLAH